MIRPAKDLPDLAVAIASHGSRLLGIVGENMPAEAGVIFHLFLQAAPDTPEVRAHLARLGQREDLHIHHLAGLGLARSRNAAIDDVDADLLVFADDDMTLCTDVYAAIRRVFAADAGLDILCARIITPDGTLRKTYGVPGQRLRVWNCAKVGSPEIVLRLHRVRAARLRFDENFGAGTPNWLGEEYIFLADSLRAGLRGRHMDFVLGVHPPESSGVNPSAKAMRVRQAVFRRALGPLSGPAFALFRFKQIWKHRRFLVRGRRKSA